LDGAPQLFGRYLAQVNAPVPPVIQEMPAWAAAQRAATAAAALLADRSLRLKGLASTLPNLGEPRVGRLAIECGLRPERTLP
jgi:hypothetical protein